MASNYVVIDMAKVPKELQSAMKAYQSKDYTAVPKGEAGRASKATTTPTKAKAGADNKAGKGARTPQKQGEPDWIKVPINAPIRHKYKDETFTGIFGVKDKFILVGADGVKTEYKTPSGFGAAHREKLKEAGKVKTTAVNGWDAVEFEKDGKWCKFSTIRACAPACASAAKGKKKADPKPADAEPVPGGEPEGEGEESEDEEAEEPEGDAPEEPEELVYGELRLLRFAGSDELYDLEDELVGAYMAKEEGGFFIDWAWVDFISKHVKYLRNVRGDVLKPAEPGAAGPKAIYFGYWNGLTVVEKAEPADLHLELLDL